jgi:hypothetical protein
LRDVVKRHDRLSILPGGSGTPPQGERKPQELRTKPCSGFNGRTNLIEMIGVLSLLNQMESCDRYLHGEIARRHITASSSQ